MVCHKFPKELSLVVVCSDDMAMQLMLTVLVIDHLAVVHQCLDACNEILGGLSQPGHNILKFSEVHMGVGIMCPSLLDCVKEGRSFHLGCSLFLFTASRHPLCMHLWDLYPRAAKMYQRWSWLSGRMWLRRSQFSRVCWNMEKEWYATFKSQS